MLTLSGFLSKFFDPLLSDDLFIMGPDFDNSKQHTPCQCLSECSGLIYLIETSEGDLERKQPMALGSVTLL